MGSVQVKINSAEAARILKSKEVADRINAMGEAITAAANEQAPEHGYDIEPFALWTGVTDRAVASVYTRTNLGKAMQAKHSTLTQAMDAGRG